MNKQQSGFTLIELVLVIVILGILAATALPRFSDLSTQACDSGLKGMADSIRSAAAIARATQLAQGIQPSSPVTIDGQAVTMASGYPTHDAAGIGAALQQESVMNPSGSNPRVYTLRTNATVSYTNNAPGFTVAIDSSGC